MSRSASALALCLASLMVWTTADAKPKKGEKKAVVEEGTLTPVWPSPLDAGLLDPVFRELPFGQDMEELLRVLALRMEEQIKPVLKVTGNARDRDAMKEGLQRSLNETRSSLVDFKGQQTPYSASVVADEYKDNVNESLMRYVYGNNHAYFFMSEGKFWKMVLCMETNGSIADLVNQGLEKYGPSANIFWADEEKKTPLRAQWKDSTFEVSFEPSDDVFVCKRLVWVYLPEKDRVVKARGSALGAGAGGNMAEDLLKQITDPTPTPAPNQPKEDKKRK